MPPEATGQPLAAPESTADSLANAAEVFKAFDANPAPEGPDAPPPPRTPDGRYAPRVPPVPEPEATDEDEAEAAEPEPDAAEQYADADEEAPDDDESSGQPSQADMPHFWPPEHAETWAQLPAETQGIIAAREAQREAAVNSKFQESATVRKAAEAIQAQAQAHRDQALAVTEAAISLIQPQWPSSTMLDVTSDDYDPDGYHLARANAENAQAYLNQLMGQRQQLVAQNQQAGEAAEQQHAAAINQHTLPAFIDAYPEAIDQARSKEFYGSLVKFAIDSGAPEDFFLTGPITALEWHFIADARSWRQHKAALSKVKGGKPAPKQATPPVRPGVATPKGAVKATQRKQAMDRLAKSGSLQDAAAVFKTFG